MRPHQHRRDGQGSGGHQCHFTARPSAASRRVGTGRAPDGHHPMGGSSLATAAPLGVAQARWGGGEVQPAPASSSVAPPRSCGGGPFLAFELLGCPSGLRTTPHTTMYPGPGAPVSGALIGSGPATLLGPPQLGWGLQVAPGAGPTSQQQPAASGVPPWPPPPQAGRIQAHMLAPYAFVAPASLMLPPGASLGARGAIVGCEVPGASGGATTTLPARTGRERGRTHTARAESLFAVCSAACGTHTHPRASSPPPFFAHRRALARASAHSGHSRKCSSSSTGQPLSSPLLLQLQRQRARLTRGSCASRPCASASQQRRPRQRQQPG